MDCIKQHVWNNWDSVCNNQLIDVCFFPRLLLWLNFKIKTDTQKADCSKILALQTLCALNTRIWFACLVMGNVFFLNSLSSSAFPCDSKANLAEIPSLFTALRPYYICPHMSTYYYNLQWISFVFLLSALFLDLLKCKQKCNRRIHNKGVIHSGDPSQQGEGGMAGGQRGPASRAALPASRVALHSRQRQVLHPHPSSSLWGTF